MIEALFELIAEFMLQAVLEALVELGLHSMAEPLRKPPNPWLAALGYTLIGVCIGGLSLIVFPTNFVSEPWRFVNLIITPTAVGALMSMMGALRARRGGRVLRIDRFAYGYLFALSLGIIRYLFAS